MPASHHRRSQRRIRPLALLLSAMLVAALLPATIAGAANAPTLQPRVFGGVDADIADLPSLAFVNIEDAPGTGTGSGCTGTVIAPEWVLTAAHCFEDTGTEVVTVFLGQADLDDLTIDDVYAAAEFILHPDWNPAAGSGVGVEYRGDVALVRLAEPTDQPAQPLVATGTPPPVGQDAVIAGWGEMMPGQPASVLQRAEVPVVDGEVCRNGYGPAAFDLDRHVCAGGEVADTCVGDSGGPLMVERNGQLWQYGVTNYGPDEPCGDQDLPGAYASVAFYRSWIEDNTGIEILPEFVPGPDAPGTDAPDPDPDAPDPDAPEPDADPLPLPTVQPASEVFSDVSDDDSHAEGIAWVAATGITTGFPDGTFKPGQFVTRGQMATFLLRASDDLEPSPTPPDFLDVDPGNVHAPSIAAVAEVGITTGFQDGTFRPDQPVTRGQMATFLVRASDDLEPSDTPPPFSDVDPGNVHAPSIAAVADAGIAGGFADGTYGPNRDVTRGQMATFLARTFLWFGPTPPSSD